MQSFLRVLLAAAAAALELGSGALHGQSANQPPTRPKNVLLITVDDMNYNSPTCFGGPAGLTPHIDRLADQGMKFQQAFVALAICQASRQSMMTGRYPLNGGFRWFEPVKAGVPLLPVLLEQHGFLNACLGKAEHLEPRAAYHWTESRNLVEMLGGRNPALYHQLCAEFIRRADAAGKPFFLMANSHDPHRPFSGADEEAKQMAWVAKKGGILARPSHVYTPDEAMDLGFLPATPVVKKEVAQYMSSVRRADDTVGEILRALDETGHHDDTLVIFLSDNGAAFPFAKACCYLNSDRTPLIVRWPGHVPPGSVDRTDFVNEVDLLPTILEALGFATPDGVDGRSWLSLAEGGHQEGRDGTVSTLYDAYPVEGQRRPDQLKWYQMRVVYQGRYGYIYNGWAHGQRNFGLQGNPEIMKDLLAHGYTERVRYFHQRVPEELYDYVSDPNALHNLADRPELQPLMQQMRTRLLQWMVQDHDSDLVDEYKVVQHDRGVNEHTPFGLDYLKLPVSEVTAGEAQWKLVRGGIPIGLLDLPEGITLSPKL